jgi:hypothetical protein
MNAVSKFVRELRANPELAAVADQVGSAILAVDIEADGNPHMLQFHAGVDWILRQDRTAEEKLEALRRLSSLKGKVTASMQDLTGWST